MIPTIAYTRQTVTGLSRTRGGDPISLVGWYDHLAFIPHTRGDFKKNLNNIEIEDLRHTFGAIPKCIYANIPKQ